MTTEETFAGYADGLPDDLDFDGRTVMFLTSLPFYGWNETDHRDILITEETGDVLNDSIYLRDLNVTERLNFVIGEEQMKYQECEPYFVKLVKSGDSTFDVVSLTARDLQSVRMLEMMMNSRIYDLGDTIYNIKIRDGFVLNVFTNKKAVSASDVEKNRASIEKELNNAVESISKYFD